MSTVERIEKLEDQTSSPGLTPPDRCVFCYKSNTFWYQLIQIAYQKKVGHKVEHSEPCIHHKDSWLLWTVETANFIGGSFRDIAQDSHRNFVLEQIKDTAKMKKQLEALYAGWQTHSSWMDIYSENNKRVRDGKPKKYKYIDEIDDAADKEDSKIMEQRTIEYEKALEIIQYFK